MYPEEFSGIAYHIYEFGTSTLIIFIRIWGASIEKHDSQITKFFIIRAIARF